VGAVGPEEVGGRPGPGGGAVGLRGAVEPGGGGGIVAGIRCPVGAAPLIGGRPGGGAGGTPRDPGGGGTGGRESDIRKCDFMRRR
jgi:hypothetical protein